MKKSVRIAAKAHNAALLIILVCGFLIAITAVFGHSSSSIPFLAVADTIAWPLIGLGFLVIFVSGFHIAVSDALQRMEHREKSSKHE